MRVVVAGAGALGVAAALHLCRSGHEVVLLERDQVAGATTGLAAGLLSLGVQDPLERRLVMATMRGLETLAQDSGVESPLRRPGSFVLAREPHEVAHLEELERDLGRLDEPCQWFTPREWADVMGERGLPAEEEGVERVLSVPGDAWALTTEATQLMLRGAKDAGVQVRQQAAIKGLTWNKDRVTGVRLADETVEADHVVLAMGAWTRPFLESEGYALPLLAFTTHAAILSLETGVDAPIIHDHPGHYYFRPESGTHLLVGNGTNTDPSDPLQFHPTPDPDFFSKIAAKITKRFPALRSARLQNAWRGILTATPDRAALVGAHPDAEGLFVMTGDNGYGFMRSYALGAVLAVSMGATKHLPEGIPKEALAHMDPARFWPDPPSVFPAREGFELVAEEPADPAG